MERLTYNHEEQIKDSQGNIVETINHGDWLKDMSFYDICENACVLYDEDKEDNPSCEECPLKQAFTKLAAYEDSGLTPTQVQELANLKAEGLLLVLQDCDLCANKGNWDDCGYCINRETDNYDNFVLREEADAALARKSHE